MIGLERRLQVQSQLSLQNNWDIRAIVSNALRYCAGSLCFMTAGTNLTALMKGMSSLTAQLKINTFSKSAAESSASRPHTDAVPRY